MISIGTSNWWYAWCQKQVGEIQRIKWHRRSDDEVMEFLFVKKHSLQGSSLLKQWYRTSFNETVSNGSQFLTETFMNLSLNIRQWILADMHYLLFFQFLSVVILGNIKLLKDFCVKYFDVTYDVLKRFLTISNNVEFLKSLCQRILSMCQRILSNNLATPVCMLSSQLSQIFSYLRLGQRYLEEARCIFYIPARNSLQKVHNRNFTRNLLNLGLMLRRSQCFSLD